jgi:hypothetical protein
MPRISLVQVYAHFLGESSGIQQRFVAPVPTASPWDASCIDAHRDGREMCVVRLHDAWARFCRELVVVSAGGEPVTAGGAVVARAAGINQVGDVIPTLRSTYSRRQQRHWREPRWADAATCIDAAQRLAITNIATVSAAIGATPSPVEHVRRVRNFIAHRGRATAIDAAIVATSVGLSRFTQADDVVSKLVPPGMPLFVSWCTTMALLGKAAIQ